MSGRSGYRKTDRKRNRHAIPRTRSDYVLRLQLPAALAFALSPGPHGVGVTVGFNDAVFASGHDPAHCCQLAADFLDCIGARECPVSIPARLIKLLPCPAHWPITARPGFKPIGNDLESIHDRISRNTDGSRPCTVAVTAEQISFAGVTPRGIVHDFAGSESDRDRAQRDRLARQLPSAAKPCPA